MRGSVGERPELCVCVGVMLQHNQGHNTFTVLGFKCDVLSIANFRIITAIESTKSEHAHVFHNS